jgi:hypothetical protein
MTTLYEQIVRELAENDPLVDVGCDDEPYFVCAFCDAEGEDTDAIERKHARDAAPADASPYKVIVTSEPGHAPDCLWLRAREALVLQRQSVMFQSSSVVPVSGGGLVSSTPL